MENNLHDIEWIERYLDRSLSPAERKDMEKRLTEDPELRNKYLEYRQLIDGVKYAHLEGKLEQLRVLERSLPEVESEASDNRFRIGVPVKYLAIAATLVLVVVSYVLLTRPEDPQKLYAKYFEAYPNVFEPTLRGQDPRTDPRSEAFQAYDRGDYQKAAGLFNALLKEKEEPGILLLLGNANLMLNKPEEAQNNFLTLIKNFDELEGQAKWYLGLAYLKQGQTEKARLILQELGEPEVTYSKKANELLKEVK